MVATLYRSVHILVWCIEFWLSLFQGTVVVVCPLWRCYTDENPALITVCTRGRLCARAVYDLGAKTGTTSVKDITLYMKTVSKPQLSQEMQEAVLRSMAVLLRVAVQ